MVAPIEPVKEATSPEPQIVGQLQGRTHTMTCLCVINPERNTFKSVNNMFEFGIISALRKYLGPFLGKQESCGFSHASRRAGDQCYFPFELHTSFRDAQLMNND